MAQLRPNIACHLRLGRHPSHRPSLRRHRGQHRRSGTPRPSVCGRRHTKHRHPSIRLSAQTGPCMHQPRGTHGVSPAGL
eukprot:11158075-Lingulodinium_polyedra.AAC.1